MKVFQPRRWRWAAAAGVGIMLVTTVLAGCGSQASSATQASAASTQTAAAPATSITLAYSATTPALDSLGLFYARDHGIFKQFGLNVKILMLNGDTLALDAAVSGEAQAAFISNQALYQGIEKGAALKGFFQLANKQDYVLLADSKIKSITDLQGHILGTSGPGGIAEVIPFLALKQAGGSTAKVTEVNAGGTGGREKALISGTIDAGIAHYVDALSFLAQTPSGKFHIVTNFAKTLPYFQDLVLVGKSSTLTSDSKPYTLLAEALLTAQKDIYSNKAAAVAEFRKYNPQINATIAGQAYTDFTTSNVWSETGGLNPKYLNYTVKALVQVGRLAKPLTAAQAYDTSILTAAKAAVAGSKG